MTRQLFEFSSEHVDGLTIIFAALSESPVRGFQKTLEQQQKQNQPYVTPVSQPQENSIVDPAEDTNGPNVYSTPDCRCSHQLNIPGLGRLHPQSR